MIAVQSSRDRKLLFETGKVDIKCERCRFRAAGTDRELGIFEFAGVAAKRAPTCRSSRKGRLAQQLATLVEPGDQPPCTGAEGVICGAELCAQQVLFRSDACQERRNNERRQQHADT